MIDSHYHKLPLEVAVFSGESILKAQAQGASRVELNAPGSYVHGGTTPPVSELTKVADQIRIPVRIMIRPRGPPGPSDDSDEPSHDFIYSADELASMAQSIRDFKATGLLNPLRGDGFVFGLLKQRPSNTAADSFTGRPESLSIDEANCKTLIALAKPFGCVFHRAFDPIASTRHSSEAVETLINLGFEGLLTAGGPRSCLENIDRIDSLCHRFAGRIQIVVGGGLRAANIYAPSAQLAIYQEGDIWMHTAALTKRPDHPMEEIDSDELIRMVTQLGSVSPT